jgi:hypothetical protein
VKTIKRDVAGHFCDNQRCGFWMHSDICTDESTDAYTETLYCVSLIGEYGSPGEWRMLNFSGSTYEVMVFDKKSKEPWMEIETLRTSDKDEAIKAFQNFVAKYKTLATAMEVS